MLVLAAFRPVEDYPNHQVFGEIYEAVFDTGRDE
jgi:hypothetical protein